MRVATSQSLQSLRSTDVANMDSPPSTLLIASETAFRVFILGYLIAALLLERRLRRDIDSPRTVVENRSAEAPPPHVEETIPPQRVESATLQSLPPASVEVITQSPSKIANDDSEKTSPIADVEPAAAAAASPGKISSKKSGYFTLDFFTHISCKPISPEDRSMIARLREAVLRESGGVDDAWVTNDESLWRYLLARKHNFEGARRQAVAAVEWRRKRNPDRVRVADIAHEIETGKLQITGRDRHGRPIILMDSSRENTRDPAGNMAALVFTLNRAIRMMRDPVRKYVIVIRLGDTSMFDFSKLPGPAQVKETIKILMTVFAERLGHGILYMPPRIFTLFLNVFRSLMDAHVLSKAVWITGDVSPGSPNDRALLELVGDDWRRLFGEGQPIYSPGCVPGYKHEETLKILRQEEEEEVVT